MKTWLKGLIVGIVAFIGTAHFGIWFLIPSALLGIWAIGIGGFPNGKR